MRRLIRSIVRALREWLSEDEGKRASSLSPQDPVIFDNEYQAINRSMDVLLRDPQCRTRPHYAWGVLAGAALGKALGYSRISVIEFGVAGGAGLVAMERAAELTEQLAGIHVDVYGFDSGSGLPKPQDYRDVPFAWAEGYYPIDVQKLQRRLRRAQLKLGLIRETIPIFLESAPAPIAFVGVDLCLYSSAREALRLFCAEHQFLLPRVTASFRCINGKYYTDYTGERLAISEFNSENSMRKLSPIYNLRSLVPADSLREIPGWPEWLYTLHLFNHPRYGDPDSMQKSMGIDVDGKDIHLPVGASPNEALANTYRNQST